MEVKGVPAPAQEGSSGADILPMGGTQVEVTQHDLEVEAGRVDLASGL